MVNRAATRVSEALGLPAGGRSPSAASVRALNQAGIPVFTVNVIVSADDLKAQNASFVEYVGADQIAGGRAYATWEVGQAVCEALKHHATGGAEFERNPYREVAARG